MSPVCSLCPLCFPPCAVPLTPIPCPLLPPRPWLQPIISLINVPKPALLGCVEGVRPWPPVYQSSTHACILCLQAPRPPAPFPTSLPVPGLWFFPPQTHTEHTQTRHIDPAQPGHRSTVRPTPYSLLPTLYGLCPKPLARDTSALW